MAEQTLRIHPHAARHSRTNVAADVRARPAHGPTSTWRRRSPNLPAPAAGLVVDGRSLQPGCIIAGRASRTAAMLIDRFITAHNR